MKSSSRLKLLCWSDTTEPQGGSSVVISVKMYRSERKMWWEMNRNRTWRQDRTLLKTFKWSRPELRDHLNVCNTVLSLCYISGLYVLRTIGPCITPIWAPPAFSSKPPAIWAAKFCEKTDTDWVCVIYPAWLKWAIRHTAASQSHVCSHILRYFPHMDWPSSAKLSKYTCMRLTNSEFRDGNGLILLLWYDDNTVTLWHI